MLNGGEWRHPYGFDGKLVWFDHFVVYLWLSLSGTRISWAAPQLPSRSEDVSTPKKYWEKPLFINQ